MVNQSAFKETRATQLTRMRQQEKNTVDRKTALLPAPDLFKSLGEHIFSPAALNVQTEETRVAINFLSQNHPSFIIP